MESTGQPSIFISYSRHDKPWREQFRGQLQAALFEKARVWCDEDLEGGKNWKDSLTEELERADVALVLASTDYLKSQICRQELRVLCDKYREKRLQSVFWLPVRSCPWRASELEAFQWPRALAADTTLSDLTDSSARDRLIVKVVEEICGTVQQIEATQNPTLKFLKALIGDEAVKRHLRIDSMISNEGDFAHVCRGRDGSKRDVAVKIVPRTRISSSFESVARAAVQRQQLRDPGFIRVYDSFRVNSPYGEHLVLVMEYFEGKRLLDVMASQPGRRFDTDSTVTLLRRAAEALRELHRAEVDDADPRDFGFGPMLPEHLFYDQRAKRVRFSALSVSNCARDALGWQLFASVFDAKSSRCMPPELDAAAPRREIDKHKIDQFMLGQLALELLGDRHKWTNINPQLDRIVQKMLASDPQARWRSMEEVVTQLRSVEGEPRALAKASYMKWIDGDARFFEEFYERFFASMQARGVDSRSKFRDREQQIDKLRKGMAAVLNFHPGNEPTSMRYVSDVHRNTGVTEVELDQFAATFIGLLKERLDQRMAPDDELAGRKDEILQAWHELLTQVLDYFRQPVLTPPR